MEKRLALFGLIFAVFVLGSVSAEDCVLSASLINQDPYPAMPGEYVKVVFQLSGVENPECGGVSFELVESYPFSLDASESPIKRVIGGVYAQDFESFLLAPYKMRVDENAVDGENKVKVKYEGSGVSSGEKNFNITVDDVRTDFELSIKNYDFATEIMTFEILNIGEHDVEALTVEIPQQEGVGVKGGDRNILGSLDSNEDTTFTYEVRADDGNINLVVYYTDEIGVRRRLDESVVYDSSYFSGRRGELNEPRPLSFYVAVGLVLLLVLLWARGKLKKRKEKLKNIRMTEREHRKR